MTTYRPGTVILANGRHGLRHCVIASSRVISKGRYAGIVEYVCAPLKECKYYSFTFRGESLFKKPTSKYTKKQIEAALVRMVGTKRDIEEKKQKRADRGRKAIGNYDYQRSTYNKASGTNIAIGDEVHVQYTNGSRWERVVWVNFKTGKVAIAKHVPPHQPTDELMEMLNVILGQRGRKRGRRDYRYIHPDFITEVRTRGSK